MEKHFCAISIYLFYLIGCSGHKPENIGNFISCPNKPNCVSTKDFSKQNSIKPFKYDDAIEDAKERLLNIIVQMPGARLVINRDKFIHVEFTSRFMRFVDDVEFYFNKPGRISLRSASRLGYSDMGVNRRRMEKIRNLFEGK